VGLVDKYKLKGGREVLAKIFKKYIVQEGNKLNEARKRRMEKRKTELKKHFIDLYKSIDSTYIEGMLTLYRKCDLFYDKVFEREAKFKLEMGKGFEVILNHNWDGDRAYQTVNVLAYYLDKLLKETKKVGDDDITKNCNEALVLLDYLHDRDVFLHTSAQLFALRLMDAKFKTFSREENILASLKARYGSSFGSDTLAMESMLKERKEKQNDTLADWEKSTECASSDGKGKFVPRTHSVGAWQIHADNLNMRGLPKQVQTWMKAFETHYGAKHDSHQLTYRHDLSSVELEYNCGGKRYTITMWALQAAALLMFTSKDKVLTLTEIQEALMISKMAYVQLLMRSMEKSKIIEKICDDDRKSKKNPKFRLSSGFKSKKIKLDIRHKFSPPKVKYFSPPYLCLGGVWKVGGTGGKIIGGEFWDDLIRQKRDYIIQAAIVRTMKTRKRLTQRDLVAEVLKAVENLCKPRPANVTRQIENMIKRGYLKRDEEDSKVLLYIS